jgi:16S rRNA (guanine527-N7)-methyltransferase
LNNFAKVLVLSLKTAVISIRMTEILKYFPNLTDEQQKQFAALLPLYKEWNEKINVISRKDIDNLYLHHVLHSLAIAKVLRFKDGSRILDLGTGGGFPGIPLAILHPSVSFTLVDSTAKKIRVVQEVAEALGLKNIEAQHIRVEDIKGVQFDFVVTRAVTSLDQLFRWSRKLIKTKHINILPNGIFALKGGSIKEEVKALGKGEYVDITNISKYFKEDYFEEKVVAYVQG